MNRRRSSKRKAILGLLSAVVLIAVFGLILHLIEKHGEIDVQFGDSGGWGDSSEEFYLTFGDRDYLCSDVYSAYVIAGTDNGGDDLGEGFNGELADFIVLMIADKATKKYAFFQIDRNTMTDIPVPDKNGKYDGSTFKEQICTSHWYGKTPKERNNNLVNAVSGLFGGLSIDGYYVLNMEDLDRVNHALGGVTVEVETDMTKVDPAFIKGSEVTLSDGQAEAYLRARVDLPDDTNAARMSRHRQYMQQAFSTVSERLHDDPDYINTLYGELEDCIQTDLGNERLSVIAKQITEYENQGIISPDGETRIADTFGDGTDHEEFYADIESLVSSIGRVMEIRRDD